MLHSLVKMPVDVLKRHPGNPRLHNLRAIAASITKYGFKTPVLLDDKTGFIVAGHGRVEALKQLRDLGGEPPKGAEEWCVPCVRVPFENAAQARTFLVAENKTTELGGWDSDALAEIVREMDADLVGLFGMGGAMAAILQAPGVQPHEEISVKGASEGALQEILERSFRQFVVALSLEEYDEAVGLIAEKSIDDLSAWFMGQLRG